MQSVQPVGCALRQEPRARVTPMECRTIPDEQHRAFAMAQQMTHADDNALPSACSAPGARPELAGFRYGAADR